jgi:glutamate N-acetyltransferase/amino-acid N-acetyltransferase
MPVRAGRMVRAKLKGGKARALVVNSGNANAFTGKNGRTATALHRRTSRQGYRLQARRDLPRLDRRDRRAARRQKFDGVLASLARRAPEGWLAAAKAIMTTDTFPKVATATVKLGKATVTINGIAKGAGMIAPDMATMLSFVFTDAPIRRARCRRCSEPASATRSTPSPSTATPRPPTRCSVRHRRRRARGAPKNRAPAIRA